jgi:uncharacterized protein YcbK (DUF882 family)
MRVPIRTFCLLFFIMVSSATAQTSATRTLKFYHTHTGKNLEVNYFSDGKYSIQAMNELKIFLADWRDQQQQEIDPKLMDILWRIQQVTDNQDTYEIISAYRSRQTNEMLRKKSSGVAKFSQHVMGRAIDVRLRGLETTVLRDTARRLQLGGVGYYAKSDFVHIDTGRVRKKKPPSTKAGGQGAGRARGDGDGG